MDHIFHRKSIVDSERYVSVLSFYLITLISLIKSLSTWHIFICLQLNGALLAVVENYSWSAHITSVYSLWWSLCNKKRLLLWATPENGSHTKTLRNVLDTFARSCHSMWRAPIKGAVIFNLAILMNVVLFVNSPCSLRWSEVLFK